MDKFHPCVQEWFRHTLGTPTHAQTLAWPAIFEGKHTLLLSPTGTGKTLAAFLVALNRLMFQLPVQKPQTRVLYISPLKALGADIERNLQTPIAGISTYAQQHGIDHQIPAIFVRSGDTKSADRAKMTRRPPDILITTPESLFLMLTSQARSALCTIDTVIIDEIHSLLATKRGAHLSLSLERLEMLRAQAGHRNPLQRIGLSATQKPPEEAARFLGGYDLKPRSLPELRPVCILNAGTRKQWELLVRMPKGAAPVQPAQAASDLDFWARFVPELKELVLAHKSTMIFVNSRRLSERLASALNDEAQDELCLAHHGSIAKDDRRIIEERLKSGNLRAIVATSSLELGIDVGAVDLVLQIEAPYSVASGLQRIGRAGHSVGSVSKGIVLPKYKGDLLNCAAVVHRMSEGDVEPTQCLSNPIDVLSQQIVAIASMDPIDTEELYTLTRRSACFSELPRNSFESVLDMLSGKYPSDAFSELRPRITWDRQSERIRAREGAKEVAIANAGTIPDRGLYGVFLASAHGEAGRRVGELDEEMVFESKPGEVFLLGASAWRIEEISFDRVLVSPAPGEPFKMPFWRGDKPGRPAPLGRAIGELCRNIAEAPLDQALAWLIKKHGLDESAAKTLWTYVHEELNAAGDVPSDKTIVFERYMDEMGALCVCIMAPFGAKVFAPWHLAVAAFFQQKFDKQADSVWSDDGMVFRLPDADRPPPIEWFLPKSAEVMDVVTAHLGESSLFAAHFRECAARALLLPRRRPGKRSPLWAQRRRAADLLRAASRFQSFPIVLETFRECLRDVFDMNALRDILYQIEQKHIHIRTVDLKRASPFASSLMFSYVANFLYETDAPVAERRAAALSIDMSELRALLGDTEMRELLDPGVMIELEAHLQRRTESRKAYSEDSLHDLLLGLGDLSPAEIGERVKPAENAQSLIQALLDQRRAFRFSLPHSGTPDRIAAVEDAARLRDALGISISIELPKGLDRAPEEPLLDLVGRYARTRGPFTEHALGKRFGLGTAVIHSALLALRARGEVVEGAFLPDDTHTHEKQWASQEVLRVLKQKTLSLLRKQAEAVEPRVFARFLLDFQGLVRPRKGSDALMDVLHQLKGLPIAISVLESDILPARLKNYRPSDLDLLCATGEWVWLGIEAIGQNDGRIAFFPAGEAEILSAERAPAQSPMAAKVREALASRGALFFSDLLSITKGFAPEVLSALWELVWAGEISNDTLAPLRSLIAQSETPSHRRGSRDLGRGSRPAWMGGIGARQRRGPPGSEGRWTLISRPEETAPKAGGTKKTAALALMLLERHGIVSRESLSIEDLDEQCQKTVFQVLSMMEEAGRARRGFFVSGLPAMQFALPGAEERLRAMRNASPAKEAVVLAATDPANPYGALLPWPDHPSASRPMRAAGAYVVLCDGELTAFLGRTKKSLLFFPRGPRGAAEEDQARETLFLKAISALAAKVEQRSFGNLLIEHIDGGDALHSPLAPLLVSAGFTKTSQGLFKRRSGALPPAEDEAQGE